MSSAAAIGEQPSRDMSSAPEIVVPARFGHWFGLAAAALVIAWIVYQILVNPGFQWDVVGKYMFSPSVLDGVAMTVELTALVMAVGVVIGMAVALLRLSGDPLLVSCAHAFVWFFRGIPVLVQLVFWYNLASLF